MKTILCIFAVVEMKLFQGKNTINRRQVHICLSANLYIFSLQLLCRQPRQNKLSYSSSTQQSSSISWTPLAPFYCENVVLMVTFNKRTQQLLPGAVSVHQSHLLWSIKTVIKKTILGDFVSLKLFIYFHILLMLRIYVRQVSSLLLPINIEMVIRNGLN